VPLRALSSLVAHSAFSRFARPRASRCGPALLAVLLPVVLPLFTSPARADATVVVELKRPDGSSAEGTVQLTRGDAKHRCTTDKAGRCALSGVLGGMYTVSVEQPGKPGPKDKTVVIPPSGEVKLIVNAN
jgi:hypothetical protein